MSLAALQVMAGTLAEGTPAFDPYTPFAGTTPTVYPGAIATGAVTPGANVPGQDNEERFNVWMDGFMSMSESRQLGEMHALGEKEKAGTLTPEEKRRLGFMRNLLGVTQVPEMSAEEIIALTKAGKVEQVEELGVVGKGPPSGLGMFLAGVGIVGVALIAAGKRRG
jgi:hypothetical protein